MTNQRRLYYHNCRNIKANQGVICFSLYQAYDFVTLFTEQFTSNSVVSELMRIRPAQDIFPSGDESFDELERYK